MVGIRAQQFLGCVRGKLRESWKKKAGRFKSECRGERVEEKEEEDLRVEGEEVEMSWDEWYDC